jgi:hypothetical protein
MRYMVTNCGRRGVAMGDSSDEQTDDPAVGSSDVAVPGPAVLLRRLTLILRISPATMILTL